MSAYLIGAGVTLLILLLLTAVVTRGKIFFFAWFLLLVGVAKLFGKNPFC